jgi:hypothetical protein
MLRAHEPSLNRHNIIRALRQVSCLALVCSCLRFRIREQDEELERAPCYLVFVPGLEGLRLD